MSHINYVFFGTSAFAVYILDELANARLLPQLIVTTPSLPQGKQQELIPSPVAVWAHMHGIECIAPEKLNDETLLNQLSQRQWDVFVIASYGKIVPKKIIDLPKHKTLNVHPSLLPALRGPAPLQAAILNDTPDTGVSIMLIDEQVDHGPILTQENVHVAPWPLPFPQLEKLLGAVGGKLLAQTLPAWIEGALTPQEQNHAEATFTNIIRKQDGELSLDSDQYTNWLKFNAYQPWPGVFYMHGDTEPKQRVLITDATFENDQFVIKKVKPEGKKEMSFEDYLRGRK